MSSAAPVVYSQFSAVSFSVVSTYAQFYDLPQFIESSPVATALCRLCNRNIWRLDVKYDEGAAFYTVTASCHGKAESLRIGKEETFDSSVQAVARSHLWFEEDRKRLEGDRETAKPELIKPVGYRRLITLEE